MCIFAPISRSHAALILGALVIAITLPARATADDSTEVAGTWTWSWKDGEGKTHKHVLDLESAGGKLTGRERFDDMESVKVDDLRLKDNELSFAVTRGERRAEYKGKVISSKTINGIVNVAVKGQTNEYQWTAERAIETKKD